MKSLLKKFKKFLSASLVVSSLCLPTVNQVSARLEGRVATAEDFDKFTSELEKIFGKCTESKDKNSLIECDKKFMSKLKMKELADYFYKTINEGKLTGNESTDSLAFSCAVLRILENMGIQSGLVTLKNSKNMGNCSDFDKCVVIYPLKGKSGKDCFVVIDPLETFYGYKSYNESLNKHKKNIGEFYKKEIEAHCNDNNGGILFAIGMSFLRTLSESSLIEKLVPWESFCCLDMNRYFEDNVEDGWNIKQSVTKSSTFVIDFDSCELAKKFLESETEDKRADYCIPLINWLEEA